MRILVFGAGVLGCNLAHNLYKSGKDITLLARGEWGRRIREDGLKIHPYLGMKTNDKIRVINTLDKDDLYDVIFTVVRCSQLDEVLEVLKDNVSRNVILIGNNVDVSGSMETLKDKNVYFGFTYYAGHRELDHVASVGLKKIILGRLKGETIDRSFIEEIFDKTGYKVKYESNMEDWLLCHAAAVLPIAFACYKTDGDLRKIRKDDAYLYKVIGATISMYGVLEDTGHEILPDTDKAYKKSNFSKKYLPFYKLICSTKLGKMCTSDHALNATDEMKAMNEGLKRHVGKVPEEWMMVERDTKDYLK